MQVPGPKSKYAVDKDVLKKTRSTHAHMIGRCTNPKHQKYRFYGARGITVCQRWLKFENFIADMGPRPDGKTLDRIDSSRGYELSNCRWATATEQAINRKSGAAKTVFLLGEEMTARQASLLLGLGKDTVRRRINRNLPEHEVLCGKSLPIARYRPKLICDDFGNQIEIFER